MKREITEQEFIEAVKKSDSIAELLRNLNRCPYGGAGYRFVKQMSSKYGVDISHFSGKLWSKGKTLPPRPKIQMSDILVKNRYFNTNSLKKRLIKEGYKEHKCELCGNTEWNGKPIAIELHHINGDNTDNRIENLQILCPNCHAQTETYCSKNKTGNKHLKSVKNLKTKETRICPICKKEFIPKGGQIYCSPECYHTSTKKVITDEEVCEILNLFKIYKSFEGVGKHLNITGNAVKKRCSHLGLPIHIREIKDLIK